MAKTKAPPAKSTRKNTTTHYRTKRARRTIAEGVLTPTHYRASIYTDYLPVEWLGAELGSYTWNAKLGRHTR